MSIISRVATPEYTMELRKYGKVYVINFTLAGKSTVILHSSSSKVRLDGVFRYLAYNVHIANREATALLDRLNFG